MGGKGWDKKVGRRRKKKKRGGGDNYVIILCSILFVTTKENVPRILLSLSVLPGSVVQSFEKKGSKNRMDCNVTLAHDRHTLFAGTFVTSIIRMQKLNHDRP